jgi:2-polyprenyl-6-methoxyphenol hydroxylase-like FAD-dependent oxidoreductase
VNDTTAPLRGMQILISGAGVAGPAAAYWLNRYGADTTIVEVARGLRGAGFAVDFRGPTHFAVLDRMGVLDDLRTVQTHGGAWEVVDDRNRVIFELPAAFAGGDLEVRRSDLSRILYEHTSSDTEYLFDDSITALTQSAGGVDVEFAHASARRFDLVIGADGLHSGVRRLAFGPESAYVSHLGYYLAGWELPNDAEVSTVPRHYNEPGRLVSFGADHLDPTRARALVAFASEKLPIHWQDVDAQKRVLGHVLAGMGWQTPYLLETLRSADDLYFDAISRVRVPSWSEGRVALLGDAGFGVTLGGMGVGTSIVGAYILAGELATAAGDHRQAFAQYETVMRGYAGDWQENANPGQFLAPRTATRLRVRNAMFKSRLVKNLMVRMTQNMAALELPDYAVPASV